MKVQAFGGILYHDVPKLLGRRIGLEGRAKGDKEDTGRLDWGE